MPRLSFILPRWLPLATFVVVLAASAPARAQAGAADAKPAATAVAGTAKPVEAPDSVTIDRPDFVLKYPVGWKVDTQARDYDPNGNFMLFSPKNSSVQIIILGKADDPKKVVANAVRKIDNVQITTLARSSLTTWGMCTYRGVGQNLKGKIVDSFPGGIKVFCFGTPHHDVLIIETYFSDDLQDVQSDINFISQNFRMKN